MGSWPIIARPDHVDRLVEALAAHPARAQMLRGPSGVGKTTVAAAAASALAAKGRTIVPVVALDELRDVPLGALSPLLAAARFAPHDDVADRLQELIALVGAHADTYLLVVDDAPLLDATSAAALYQLVRVFAVPALLTARDEHPITGALARLLHEDLVTVTEVPGLGLDETRELLRRRLGADPRPETLRTLFEVTHGNPLFLRELVLSAERSGGVRAGPYGVELDPSRVPPHIPTSARRSTISSTGASSWRAVRATTRTCDWPTPSSRRRSSPVSSPPREIACGRLRRADCSIFRPRRCASPPCASCSMPARR